MKNHALLLTFGIVVCIAFLSMKTASAHDHGYGYGNGYRGSYVNVPIGPGYGNGYRSGYGYDRCYHRPPIVVPVPPCHYPVHGSYYGPSTNHHHHRGGGYYR